MRRRARRSGPAVGFEVAQHGRDAPVRLVARSTLRLVGATAAQVRAMMRREAALVSGAALLTGLGLALVPLALLGIGFLGRPLPAGPLWLAPLAALAVTVLAFLGVEIPTRHGLRGGPARA